MNTKLIGSALTRAMLMSGKERVWCAISDESDESDEQAMMDLDGNDFTASIVSYHDGYFYCEAGMSWLCAVPITIVALQQDITGHETNLVQMEA